MTAAEFWLPRCITPCQTETMLGERKGHLPRLDRAYYQGCAMIFWTNTLEKRARGWLTSSFHEAFRQIMLHAAARYSVWCPAYCLMPDIFWRTRCVASWLGRRMSGHSAARSFRGTRGCIRWKKGTGNCFGGSTLWRAKQRHRRHRYREEDCILALGGRLLTSAATGGVGGYGELTFGAVSMGKSSVRKGVAGRSSAL